MRSHWEPAATGVERQTHGSEGGRELPEGARELTCVVMMHSVRVRPRKGAMGRRGSRESGGQTESHTVRKGAMGPPRVSGDSDGVEMHADPITARKGEQ